MSFSPHHEASLSEASLSSPTARIVETILQLSASSPARPLNPKDFCYDDLEGRDINALVGQIKQSALRGIYLVPNTPAPPGIAECLADKAIFGRFRYHPDGTRQKREEYSSVSFADLQDSCPFITLTDDSSADDRFKRALVMATTAYFRIARDVKPLTYPVISLVVGSENDLNRRPLQASAYFTELISFIFDSVSGDQFKRINSVAKLVVGVPVKVFRPGFEHVGNFNVDSEIQSMYKLLLHAFITNSLHCEQQPSYSNTFLRWQASLLAKTGFAVLHPQQRDIIKVTCQAVRIDYAHNIIEQGLALCHTALGSAIIGPGSAALTILNAIVGCTQFRKEQVTGDSMAPLVDADRGIEVAILGITIKEESMIRMVGANHFTTEMLANFIDGSIAVFKKVLISKEGHMLYFPTWHGPWRDKASGGDKNGRDPMKLVFRAPAEVPTGDLRNFPTVIDSTISEKGQRLLEEWLEESPVSAETKKRFRYIVNKPGRALVKRHGIRGSYGRLIAAGLLVCGVVVSERNFAGRDNWLERLFDGAQAASLLAAVVIVLIFFSTRTLTNSLDLLAGVTEAQDIDHMLSLTGLTLDELQGVLTYARGTLYWLSEDRASYCRAARLGTIVMTHPLNVEHTTETRNSFFASEIGENGEAVAGWIAQSRVTRMKSTGSGDGLFRAVEDARLVELIVDKSYASWSGEIE